MLERGVRQPGEDVVGESGRKRVAAEGGAVVTGDDAVGDVLGDDRGADGEAVAEGFGGGEDVRVGVGAGGLVGPEVAGAGEAGLDLVMYEDCACFCAAGAEGAEEGGGGDVDAAFALNGLDEDAAGGGGDEGEGGGVVVGGGMETGEEGGEGRGVFGVRGRGEGAEGAAVEGVVEGEDVMFGGARGAGFADFAAEFDGGFVGFGAGVRDEGAGGGVHATLGFGGGN